MKFIRSIFSKLITGLFPELSLLKDDKLALGAITSHSFQTKLTQHVKLEKPYQINDAVIGNYTYIAENSKISLAEIGAFCSIGPNFLCGWGIHPLDGISTHPMFYSTQKQNGISLSPTDKIEERKKINIGNDVFIGANVTVLDGVIIGDGAVIGAGAVVSKDIPAYAIAVGCPVQVIKYRHSPEVIEKLLAIKWWNWELEKLKEVEKYFNDVDGFVKKYSH